MPPLDRMLIFGMLLVLFLSGVGITLQLYAELRVLDDEVATLSKEVGQLRELVRVCCTP